MILGLPLDVYQIYKLVLDKHDKDNLGLTKEQILAIHKKEFNKPLKQRRLTHYVIPNLLASGLVYTDETTGNYKLSKNIVL